MQRKLAFVTGKINKNKMEDPVKMASGLRKNKTQDLKNSFYHYIVLILKLITPDKWHIGW